MKNINMTKLATKEYSEIKNLMVGVLLGYAITIISFLGYAMLLTYTDTSDLNINTITTIITVFSVLVAGFDTAKNSKNKGLLWGLLSGFTYSLILLIVGNVFVENFVLDIQSIFLIFLSILAGAIGGVFGINLKRK